MTETPEQTGRTLGKHRIVEEIGRGGMATVYKALDTKLQRTVALKALLSPLARERDFHVLFRKDATTPDNRRSCGLDRAETVLRQAKPLAAQDLIR
jgi:serine/threonine protein kinase